MKILIVLLFIGCFAINCKAQTLTSQDTSCSFLKNLKFKHGVDTLVFNAVYLDLVEPGPFTTYEESFLKKRRVNLHKIGAELYFQPENCTKEFSASLMVFADKEDFLDGENLGKYMYNTRFFLKNQL
jgi:hypothetical protein